MPTVWITYAWIDNQQNDVDFIAQELGRSGIQVKLDRWNIAAGKRLWDQISSFILDPKESNAWLLIATENSLRSEPCKEEFSYALHRALTSRGLSYPVIALFIGPVDNSLIPPAIVTRLFVSITDPDWKERIVAAVENRPHQAVTADVTPFFIKTHKNVSHKAFAIEVRPRAGVWSPFFAGIPASEKDTVKPHIMPGPRDYPTSAGMLFNAGEGLTDDGKYWLMGAGNQATPNDSYYVWCDALPSELVFGVSLPNRPQYSVPKAILER